MFKHPEQRDDEIYLGNATETEYEVSSWVNKRLGEVAYNHWGQVVTSRDNYFPMFLARSEVEAKLKLNISDEERKVYQDMLDKGELTI